MPDLRLHAFLLLSTTALFSISFAFSGSESIFLSCGASDSTVVEDRRVFIPDSTFLSTHLSGSKVETVVHGSDVQHPLLYRTARVFSSPSSYRFQIKKRGTHLVRFHFYPFVSGRCDLSTARFHVVASGNVVLLSNFEVTTGGKMAPFSRGCGVHMPRMDEKMGVDVPFVLKEYFLWVDSDELEITFVPADRSSFAYVNAIEVVSAPGLVPDIVLSMESDQFNKLNGMSKQEFEVLFRINTGGAKITPFNDTMWRNWVPDEEFFKSNDVSEKVYFGGRIHYHEYGATPKIAPYHVYDTARVMKLANLQAPEANMTWVFSVPHGYRYLIRLHFCDIASLALGDLYFNIYINGYLAVKDFDLSQSSDWNLATPYYLDFVVEPDTSGNLSIIIAPSKLSKPEKVNGLLNGLEIMKLNNSVGNLDDDFPMSMMAGSQRMGIFRAFLRMFLLCGTVFVAIVAAGYMVLMKWRNTSNISAEWSALPTFAPDGKLSFGDHISVNKSVQL